MIPQGTQLIDTAPPSNRGAGGELVWEIGSLEPGEERTVEMQLMPTAEGEIGSVATVRFHARASVRTLATKPMLSIEVLGPSKVMKGQQLTLRIKLSNPGSGATAGVMLSETVPQGLSHAAGKELEFEVGTLKPGESRELDLTLTAAEAGMVTNVISADAEAKLHAEAHTEIEIVAPLLQVSMTGPEAPLPGAQCVAQHLGDEPRHRPGQEHRPGGCVAADLEICRSQQRRTVRRGNPCRVLEPRRTAAAGNRHGQADHAPLGSRRSPAGDQVQLARRPEGRARGSGVDRRAGGDQLPAFGRQGPDRSRWRNGLRNPRHQPGNQGRQNVQPGGPVAAGYEAGVGRRPGPLPDRRPACAVRAAAGSWRPRPIRSSRSRCRPSSRAISASKCRSRPTKSAIRSARKKAPGYTATSSPVVTGGRKSVTSFRSWLRARSGYACPRGRQTCRPIVHAPAPYSPATTSTAPIATMIAVARTSCRNGATACSPATRL